VPRAKVILDLVTSKFGKGLKDTEKKWKRWKKSIFSVKSALGAIFLGAIARKVIAFGKDAVGAYEQQELAVQNLASALAMAGDKSRGSVEDMKAFASEIQNITTIGDETTLAIMKLGASMGKMTGKDLKQATVAAIGLSRALGINLESAMKYVARARQGEFTALGRYMPQLKELTTVQEKWNLVLGEGARGFGIARGEIEATTGKLKQWKNAWGDIKESYGKGIAEAFREAGTEIMKALTMSKAWNDQWGEFLAMKVKEELLGIAEGFTYIAAGLRAITAIAPITWVYGLLAKGEMPWTGAQRRLGEAGAMYETGQALGRRTAQAGAEAEYAKFRAEHRGALKQIGDAVINNTKEEAERIRSQGATGRK